MNSRRVPSYRFSPIWLIGSLLFTPGTGLHAADEADIAQQLANPISSLISVPLQFNHDRGYGEGDNGTISTLNIQPVVPITLNDDWNVISRTILPLTSRDDVPSRGEGESGTGDVVQSLFFSPKAPSDSGWIWGVGPVFLLPTASDASLGGEKWGAGPTAVALKQQGPWTYGALVNHIESFAGEDDRPDVSATFLQPFLTYITPTKTTFAVNTESTYDWERSAWSVPVNFQVSQLLRAGDQLLQVGGGVRYWLESPGGGPEGWALRLNLVFVFPK